MSGYTQDNQNANDQMGSSDSTQRFANLAPPPEPTSYYGRPYNELTGIREPTSYYAPGLPEIPAQRSTTSALSSYHFSQNQSSYGGNEMTAESRRQARALAEAERLQWLENEEAGSSNAPTRQAGEPQPKTPLSSLKRIFRKDPPQQLSSGSASGKYV